MSIVINGEENRLGLALSGGGFRAAAFHLGVFRKLQQLKLLDKVDLLSCVSGGSIAGAFLCAHWHKADVLDQLEHYLGSRSIAASTIIGGLLSPFSTRLEKLAESYDRDLFDNKLLSSLNDCPRIYINTTNLSTGNMFSFVAGGNDVIEIFDHELGQAPADNISISTAVAASSAFPPAYPPLHLGQDQFPNDKVQYVTLTDGGVYDNLGMNPLLRLERNNLQYALVSDGGKPFSLIENPTDSGAAVLKESIGIMMEQIRGLQFTRLSLLHRAQRGPKPLWFSIDSKEGEQQSGDAEIASMVSTNLSALSKFELDVLGRHGGALCESRIRTYSPELIS